MKKWLIRTVAITTGLCVLSWTVHAENYPTEDTNWQVWFNAAGNKLESNYTTKDFQDTVSGMQPGDTADFEINIQNRYSTPVDWYMENSVIRSFENSYAGASGGAYTYTLTYYPSTGGTNVLYDSNKVGGEGSGAATGGVGLNEATNALGSDDDYIFLQRIPSGSRSRMLLHVALDGETQINTYQDTQAALQIDFAVEVPETEPGTPDVIKPGQGSRRRIIYVPNTADPFQALPYMIAGLLSLILFAISAYLLWRTREEK